MEPCDKNCNIFCCSKILSSWTFWLLKLMEVTSNQESVLQWIHTVIDILKSLDFEPKGTTVYLMKINKLLNPWLVCILKHRELWSYDTDSWFDVTSINFNSQKVHEDKIFERQDILQSLSQGSKYYKYAKSPPMI